MSKRIFSDTQQQALSKNINVLNVSDKSITYHPSFKLAAVKAYHNGKALIIYFAHNIPFWRDGQNYPLYS